MLSPSTITLLTFTVGTKVGPASVTSSSCAIIVIAYISSIIVSIRLISERKITN